MKLISANELAEYKILPFDIYNESGDVIANAGDNLTPGKLLQLRYISKLFCDDDANVISENTDELLNNDENTLSAQSNVSQNTQLDIEEDTFDSYINFGSTLEQQAQLQLKSSYKKAINALNGNIDSVAIKNIKNVRDKILDNIFPVMHKTYKKSQLKIIGNYDKYHGLNVALLSILLAKKMGYNDSQIADITLAALLHDIGKNRLPKEVHNSYSKNTMSKTNMLYELHPELGYKILKNEMKMPEDICVVALEHHEKNDGSGYPFGVSSDLIHPYSQIISICNVYDNLISAKTSTIVNTPQEAVKKVLEMGTSWFAPGILFSFVYMTNYHDDITLEELNHTGNGNWT